MTSLDTPTYWGTASSVRYIPAGDYVARMRAESQAEPDLTRCRACGQWTWGGVCSLHPSATMDRY